MQLDRFFEALASAPRRQILAWLAERELSTSELAERFAMTAPAVSRHLTVLEIAGLVSGERQGQFVLYRLNGPALVETLTGYATELLAASRTRKSAAKSSKSTPRSRSAR